VRQAAAVDFAAITALRSPAGQALLASLPAYDESAAMKSAQDLRAAGHDPALIAAALTQSRLRAAAVRRLGPTGAELLWTADAVEQASRTEVAQWRAGRFTAAGVRRVLDLGAGAGSDALAFAAAGIEVVAVERDPVTAAVLEANADRAGGGRITVVQADAAEVAQRRDLLATCDAVYADPARRRDGHRVLDPAGWSPPLRLVAALAAAARCGAAKVGPGIDHALVPAEAEAEWVSHRGDVVECCLWWGELRRGAARGATLLGPPVRTLTDAPAGPPPVAAPGRYLHEPDGAVLRAGLVGTVAAELDGWLLDPTIAYVSCDADLHSPWTTRYAITDVLPFSVKGLRALLRERQVGRVTIKKRGTAVTPEQLRPQLRLAGQNEATVVLTRIAGKPSALLVTPA